MKEARIPKLQIIWFHLYDIEIAKVHYKECSLSVEFLGWWNWLVLEWLKYDLMHLPKLLEIDIKESELYCMKIKRKKYQAWCWGFWRFNTDYNK